MVRSGVGGPIKACLDGGRWGGPSGFLRETHIRVELSLSINEIKTGRHCMYAQATLILGDDV